MNASYSHKEILKELRRILAAQRKIYPQWVDNPKNPLTQQEASRRNALLADAIEIITNSEGEATLFEQKGAWYEPRKWDKLPDGNYIFKSDSESAFVRIHTGKEERIAIFFFWSEETNKKPTITVKELASPDAMLYGPIPDIPPRESESGFTA